MSEVYDYAHYALGRCLEKLGRPHEANGHYKLASSLRPESERYRERILDLSTWGEPGSPHELPR